MLASLPSRTSSWSFLRLFAAGALTAATGMVACGGGGSGGSSGFTPGGDSGTGGPDGAGDSTTGSDTGANTDGSLIGADSSGSSSGGGSGSGSGSGSGAADASYDFDGFSHADGWGEASYCPDDDGDGWTVCGGDCNDHDSQINPCAFDTSDPTDPVGHDGVDNDCDGKIDNLITCENASVSGTFDANPDGDGGAR